MGDGRQILLVHINKYAAQVGSSPTQGTRHTDSATIVGERRERDNNMEMTVSELHLLRGLLEAHAAQLEDEISATRKTIEKIVYEMNSLEQNKLFVDWTKPARITLTELGHHELCSIRNGELFWAYYGVMEFMYIQLFAMNTAEYATNPIAEFGTSGVKAIEHLIHAGLIQAAHWVK